MKQRQYFKIAVTSGHEKQVKQILNAAIQRAERAKKFTDAEQGARIDAAVEMLREVARREAKE